MIHQIDWEAALNKGDLQLLRMEHCLQMFNQLEVHVVPLLALPQDHHYTLFLLKVMVLTQMELQGQPKEVPTYILISMTIDITT